MEKILIVRQGALGDVILVTPIVRELKKMLGAKCEISILTSFPFVFDNNPHVYKAYKYGQQLPNDFTRLINLNLVYENSPKEHIIDAFSIAAGLDHNYDKQPELFLNHDQILKVYNETSFLPNNFVVIHMRKYGWPNRNFSESFWQNVVKEILHNTSYSIVQIGAPDEIAFTGNDRLIDKRGQYDIHVTKGIIAKSKALICVDTGILHVGACTETPIISIFTSASHEYRKPFRNDSTIFFPIVPKYEDGNVLTCYGCQKDETPPLTDYKCFRGDNICTSMISGTELVEQLLKLN